MLKIIMKIYIIFYIHNYLMYWLLHSPELLGIFHNSVSKCYVVYLRHTVFDSFYFYW